VIVSESVRADFVILDRNLFEIPSAEISSANVTMAVFDSRTMYRNTEVINEYSDL